MAEHLAMSGSDVAVLCTHEESSTSVREVEGVQVFYIPSPNIFYPHGRDDLPAWTRRSPAKVVWHSIDSYNPFISRSIRSVLDVANPDIVHSNNLTGLSPIVWREAKRQGRAVVHTLRDYFLLCHRATMYQEGTTCESLCWHCKPFAEARLSMTNDVDAVVGISRFVLEAHCRRGGFERTPVREVIPNPYDRPVRDPSVGAFRSAFSSETLQVGFLGRLVPSKGVDVLLASAQDVGEDVHVHIGGKGTSSYVETLRRDYPIGNVTYHGYVDPSSFLPILDVLVVPSLWHEPLGRVVFEAYAHGVPVLGADRGGIPEMIDEGATGYVFEPKRPDTLSHLLQSLVEAPSRLQPMSEAAYEYASRFSPETVVGEYRDVYRQVAYPSQS
jgi:glycosyltransferase involved in cell wall biosynthesis